MKLLNEITLATVLATSLALNFNTFADTSHSLDSPTYDAAMAAAAQVFIDDVDSKYSNVNLNITLKDVIYPQAQNSFVVSDGNPQYVNQISLNNVTYNTHIYASFMGTTIEKDVSITLSLVGEVDTSGSNCRIKAQTGSYNLVSYSPSDDPYVDLAKDILTQELNNNGDNMLNTFINSSSLKTTFCPQ